MATEIRSIGNNNLGSVVCIYGNVKCYAKVWTVEKYAIHGKAQLKGKFIAYIKTW